MNFLFPLFLAGAVAVAGPILLHLIRRVTRNHLPFSSLMFLSPSPPRMQRRQRIENWPLLLLRCAALALLALAFSRPFFSQPAAATSDDAVGRRLVLLIDTSASMRRADLWTQAADHAGRLIDSLTAADRLAVIAFDHQPRTIVSFQQWGATEERARVALAKQAVASLTPTWRDTDLGSALVAAAEAVEEAAVDDKKLGTVAERRIVLVSDMQSGARVEAVRAYEWPKTTALQVEQLSVKSPTNAAMQLIVEADESVTGETQPRIRVTSAADSKHEQFHVETGVGKNEAVYIPPGQSRVIRLPGAALPGADDGLTLKLTGDDQDFDNRLYLAPHPPEVLNILYVGSEKPTDTGAPLFYFQRALQQTRTQVPRIVVRSPADLSPHELEAYQQIVVTEPLTVEQIAAVKPWLTAGTTSGGRTLLMVCKDTSLTPTLNAVTGRALEMTEADTKGYAILSEVNFRHPLLAAFADPRFSDFTSIHFWKHRRITGDLADGSGVLGRFDSGDPAWLSVPVPRGALIIFTSAWHPADSQLALSTKFVPLLYSLLNPGLGTEKDQFFIGDPVPLGRFAADAAPLTIVTPATRRIAPGSVATFDATDEPGVYTIYRDTELVGRFAVNLAPGESTTAPLHVEQLEQLGLPVAAPGRVETAEARRAERQHLQAVEIESRQKLWRWLIVAALAVLMVETVLAGRLGRRTTPVEAAT